MQKLHRFRQGGFFVLLDITGGAVYEVDEAAYELPEEELCELLEVKGIDDYADYARANVCADLKAMCLHVSHDCNLKCGYCFAGENIAERAAMTPETGRRAVDFLIAGSGAREHLEMDFFGGEPLMAWDTVTETVEYARKQAASNGKQFKFTLTTNGLLLDAGKISYINENMANVVMSLDGRKAVHDRMRPCKNNSGSYDIVLPKFKQLVETRTKAGFTDYYIRGTYTSENLDFARDVTAIADEGFRHISLEPASLAEDSPYAIRHEHMPRINSEYDKLYELVRDNGGRYSFFHFNIDLHNGPCILKRLRGCGAGNEYIAVSPNGDIYPCHRFVGIEEWKTGNIYSNGLNMQIKTDCADTHIYTKPKCVSCWARFYCAGGCNAESFILEGDSRTPPDLFCQWMKKRIECAIALVISRSATS